MRKFAEQTADHTDAVLNWSSQRIGLTRVLAAILLVVLHSPIKGLSHSVSLTWDRSPSSSVTGYRVYYGAANGNYTNSVTVGNVTAGTVSGLADGRTYYFAVAASTASGLESDLSNSLSYTVPGAISTVRVSINPSRQVTLTVTGQSGRAYAIEATQDFKTWTVIGTVTPGASGSALFTDMNATNVPKRFYRIRE